MEYANALEPKIYELRPETLFKWEKHILILEQDYLF